MDLLHSSPDYCYYLQSSSSSSSSSPDDSHRTFAYYHSQHHDPQNLHNVFHPKSDLPCPSDSPSFSSSSLDHPYADVPFTDPMITGHPAQDIYGGYQDYTPSEGIDPVSPYAYMSGYDSHESLDNTSLSDSCYAIFMHSDPHGNNEVEASLPLSKVSTYSELMPHVLDDQYHIKLEFQSPILDPQPPPPCISPSQCHEASEIPHRHHPYQQSSRRKTREPRTPGEKRRTKHSRSPRNVRLSSSPPRIPEPPHYERTPSPSSSYSRESTCGANPTTATPADISPSPPYDTTEGESNVISLAMEVEEETKTTTGKRKRRDAVNLACFFCRKRKIACKQPPEGSEDRTCGQCSTRDLICEYPKESRRGLRKASASLL